MAIGDASRVPFSEIMDNERQESVVAFLSSALRFYKSSVITVRRVMTDNGMGYILKVFRSGCTLGLKHIRTRLYMLRTNGKAERFVQTALPEWAYAAAYPNSNERSSELPRGLYEYNVYWDHMRYKANLPSVESVKL